MAASALRGVGTWDKPTGPESRAVAGHGLGLTQPCQQTPCCCLRRAPDSVSAHCHLTQLSCGTQTGVQGTCSLLPTPWDLGLALPMAAGCLPALADLPCMQMAEKRCHWARGCPPLPGPPPRVRGCMRGWQQPQKQRQPPGPPVWSLQQSLSCSLTSGTAIDLQRSSSSVSWICRTLWLLRAPAFLETFVQVQDRKLAVLLLLPLRKPGAAPRASPLGPLVLLEATALVPGTWSLTQGWAPYGAACASTCRGAPWAPSRPHIHCSRPLPSARRFPRTLLAFPRRSERAADPLAFQNPCEGRHPAALPKQSLSDGDHHQCPPRFHCLGKPLPRIAAGTWPPGKAPTATCCSLHIC